MSTASKKNKKYSSPPGRDVLRDFNAQLSYGTYDIPQYLYVKFWWPKEFLERYNESAMVEVVMRSIRG